MGNVTVGGYVFVAVKYISLMCDWYVGVVVGCISVGVALLKAAVILIRRCRFVGVSALFGSPGWDVNSFVSLAPGAEFGCKWRRWGSSGGRLGRSLRWELVKSKAVVVSGVFVLVLAGSIGCIGGRC